MGVIIDIETKISEKLNASNLFEGVYDYFIKKNDGYPYASFELQDFMGERLDSCNNTRKRIFKLVIFQEMTQRTREEAKNSLYNLTENVIDIFDKNELLDGVVTKTEVLAGGIGQYADDKGGKSLFIEMNIEFTTILYTK